MASCVTQAQVAHRSLLGPSRLSADGFLGRRPLALRWEQARCKTNMVRAYPVDKENEMKRIGALSGMRWRMLLLVFLAGYTADVAVADHEIDESNSLRFELNPLDYVPLAVGNRWTYEHSYSNETYLWGVDLDYTSG